MEIMDAYWVWFIMGVAVGWGAPYLWKKAVD